MGEGSREAGLAGGVVFAGVEDHATEGWTDERSLRRRGARFAADAGDDELFMPSSVREELVAQGVVRADEGLDALPVLGQRGLRGSEDGDDRVLLLKKNLAAELAREPRHPRLDGPSRIHVATGEQEHELRVLRRDDLGVAAVHLDG